MDLIEQINSRFLEQVVQHWPGDLDRMRRMSIIEEGYPKHVRMANLAIVGSHTVNGVSELHTELIRTRLVPDFHALWPERFQNKTNGISPRRWLCKANPGLSALVTEHIGGGWECDLDRLQALEEFADDPGFQKAFRSVKRENKQRLATLVQETTGVRIDPESMFDVHVKRLHEYKRQLLAAMHVIHLYLSIVEDGRAPRAPRTCLFAGKAAPGYFMAKLVLKLISEVARTVNADPRTEGALRVAFVPDYRVTLAERIIPAADLSEQISTAGHEASGTGNMKLALNGALTIGTLDGANIEIRDAVGPENIYIFGLRAHEVEELRASGAHDPRRHYERSASLRRVVDAIGGDRFCPDEPGAFRPLWDNLLEHGDPYLHLADFGDYVLTQRRVERDFRDQSSWTRRAIHNVARVGHFSSDRAVREYAAEIWGVDPVS
jgi:starch phosphorylase